MTRLLHSNFLLWLSTSCWILTGTAGAATIRGEVRDPDGRPVPRADVLVVARTTIVATTETDEVGRFVVANLPAGAFDIRAIVTGFRAVPTPVTLEADEVRDVLVQLQVSALAESIVVSAAQVDRLRSRVPDSVTVLTGRELAARQIDTVADALRAVPGLTVTQTGGRGGVTALFPRGGESDFTLVLVDGVPMNAFGGGYDFAYLSVADVDRIEVVRGPQSALYGGGAIGAVVQIVTRHGGPDRLEGGAEAGSFGTSRLAAAGAGTRRQWRWGAAAERVASDGYRGLLPTSGEHVGNDDYAARHAALSGSWTGPREAHVRADVRLDETERGFPGPFGSNPAGLFGGVDRISRGRTDSRVATLAGRFAWSDTVRQGAQVAYANVGSTFTSPFGQSDAGTRRWLTRAQTDVAVRADLGLSLGFELIRERATSTFITGRAAEPVPIERSADGYFAEGRFDARDRLFVVAGLRVERISRASLAADLSPFGLRPAFPRDTRLAANPKLSVAFFLQPPAARARGWTKLRASTGTGIRPPDAFEIAFTDNPSLEPERSRSIDVGIEQALFGGALHLEATAFVNRYDDLIVAVGRSLRDASRYRTDNISNARAGGLEVAATARLARRLEAALTYTWLDTKILAVDGLAGQAPPPFAVGDPLLRRPHHQAALELVASLGRFTTFARLGGRSRMLDVEPTFGAFAGLFESPGYVTTAVGGSVRLGRAFELLARVTNLFDRRYEEVLGFPALGRAGLVGVRVALRP